MQQLIVIFSKTRSRILYEVKFTKAQIEHKEPKIVRFFMPQYAKPRTLELYYDFITIFYDVNKIEELEIETD